MGRSGRGSAGVVALWALLAGLLVAGCERDNPDFIDEDDAEPTADLGLEDVGPRDGRDPLAPDGMPEPEAEPEPEPEPDGGPTLDAAIAPEPDAAPDRSPDAALPVDGDEDGVTAADDCDDADPLIHPGAPERCDGRDGDCDGQVDEGIAGLGAACMAGAGACRTDGRQVCGPDGGLMCDAVSGDPADEVCNGLDDDCDGAMDEQVAGCCEPGSMRACGSAQGACETGRQLCGPDGDYGPCEGGVAPQTEACDGADRDCDGMIDEGFALGAPCAVGVGLCVVEGVTHCAGGDVACDAAPGMPGDELCNGLDDDCDGVADEPFGELGRACAVGQGACARQGTLICGPDGTICDAAPGMPGDELCNGVDDDCDGVPDEDAGGGMPCTAGLGVCAAEGITLCDAGGMLICTARPGLGGDERCNGVDDDCDGAVDEAFPQLGEACVIQAGGCMAEGRITCAPGGGDVLCEAPPIEGAVEVCNGVDDDCDGLTDEDFGVGAACPVGVGACLTDGVIACGVDGPVCAGEPLPAGDERCNGADDDCDGQTDEGVTNACGDCGPLPDETCDGRDEDCDGQVDEGTGVCVVHIGAIAAPEGAVAFGAVLAAAGDLDGDGVGDALVGAPDGEAGLAAAVGGGAFDVLWSVADIPRFGTDVAAGDVDGDGLRELFVGSPGEPAGAVVQLDARGAEVRRIAGTADFRAGRQIAAADGAPWIVMGDRDALPTVFGPAGALRVVTVDDAQDAVILEGEAGAAMGGRLHLAPDEGVDGLPDIVTTAEDFIDRGVVRFVDPPLDQRGEPINPGFTNGSFGEGAAFGRLLADEPPMAAYGAPLTGARQTGGVYLYDADDVAIGNPLSNAGPRARQGHRVVTLPRPDDPQDELILSAEAGAELRVWVLVRRPDGRPAISTTVAVQAEGAGDSLGRSMVLGEVGPDGTRRLFVGEPDALGGGRVHVFSAR